MIEDRLATRCPECGWIGWLSDALVVPCIEDKIGYPMCPNCQKIGAVIDQPRESLLMNCFDPIVELNKYKWTPMSEPPETDDLCAIIGSNEYGYGQFYNGEWEVDDYDPIFYMILPSRPKS